MSTLLDLLAMPFTRMALSASLLVGTMCSYLGVWVVLRRVVFVGIALGQLAALGVALSFYLPLPPTVLALLTSIGGILITSTGLGGRWIPQEARVGFLYATAAAASNVAAIILQGPGAQMKLAGSVAAVGLIVVVIVPSNVPNILIIACAGIFILAPIVILEFGRLL